MRAVSYTSHPNIVTSDHIPVSCVLRARVPQLPSVVRAGGLRAAWQPTLTAPCYPARPRTRRAQQAYRFPCDIVFSSLQASLPHLSTMAEIQAELVGSARTGGRAADVRMWVAGGGA
jgi:hypothetical protein